jgi:hypothetical protein
MKTYFQFRQQLDERKLTGALVAASGILGSAGFGYGIHARSKEQVAPQRQQQVQQQVQQQPRQQVQQPQQQKQREKETIEMAPIADSIHRYESQGADYKKISRPFKDHKGNLTLGHGHLITKNTGETLQKVFADEHKKDPNFHENVLSGRQGLTNDQMKKLMHHDINIRIPQLQKMIPQFNKMPTYLQQELASEHYRGGIGKAKKTLAHINAGKFHEAAHEYLDSDEYRKEKPDNSGVAKRYDALHNALLKYHNERKGN